MSRVTAKSFAFSAVYLGDASPATDPLTKITNIRTDGVKFSDITPTKYIPWLGIQCMDGERVVTWQTTFYDTSGTDLAKLAARGISVSGALSDDSDLQAYSILFVGPDEALEDHFYAPKVVTKLDYSSAFIKDGAVEVPVTFYITSNNNTDNLYSRDDLATLVAQMGSRSPL